MKTKKFKEGLIKHWKTIHVIFTALGILYLIQLLKPWLSFTIGFLLIFVPYAIISHFYLNGGFIGEQLFNEKNKEAK